MALARRKPLGFNSGGEVCVASAKRLLRLPCCMAICYTFSMRKRTTIWLDESDRAALAKVRERYGVASDSDAIRLALRLLAESKRVNVETRGERKPQP